jgi:glycosyltransferase involved in cell wall biosynthesis
LTLKIDFVSPLPPVRSGIADYSLDLLPHLAQRCDLRLVLLPDQPVAQEVEERFCCVGVEHLAAGGRLPFYQMGNNTYHLVVHRLAMEHPGVLTLHDLVLHHFLIEQTAKEGDLEGYQRQLALDHGWIGQAAARPLFWPGGMGRAAQFALPANLALLGGQRGVLTHSAWAAAELSEEFPDLAVRAIPMGIPLPEGFDSEAGRAFRQRLGLSDQQPLLGSFGFQTPIKRTAVVIEALAAPGLSEAHLLVAGEVSPSLDLEGHAERAGVADRVHFLGFLPFDELQSAIAACDLCLNLRYPTAGETSASLLRILAVGKPVLVSDHAQSSDLPEDLVVKIPLGDDESTVLKRRLVELLADRQALAAMGLAARRYVAEQHAPARAAEAMVEACLAWRHLEPPRPSAMVPPPTSLTCGEFLGDLDVRGAQSPWLDGERRRLEIRLLNTGRARWLAAERGVGGVALEARLATPGGERSTWMGLPTDLEPGGEHRFVFDLRRPLGDVRLRILPHVFGRSGVRALGGPLWEAEI